MNIAPQPAIDGISAIPASPPQAPQPLAEIQGKTPDQIREALRGGSLDPDKLLSMLDDAEKAGIITDGQLPAPQQPTAPPSMADVMAARAAQQTLAAQPQVPAPGQPPTPAVAQPPAPAPAQKLAAEVDPLWLGHYYVDKDGKPVRTAAEAVEQLSIGKREVDKHVDYLTKERIPAIEAEKDTLAQTLENERKIREDLEKKIAAFNAQQPTPAPAAAPPAPQPQKPPEPEIKVPEVPPLPEVLSGDNVYDDAKVKKYNEDLKAHINGIQAASEAKSLIAAREESKRNEQLLTTRLNELQDNFKKELQKVSTLAQPPAAAAAPAVAPQPDIKAAQEAEFREIDAMVTGHKTLFGDIKRSVRDIETENIQFMRNLAQAAGVQGDIFETVRGNNGEDIVRIRPYVYDLVRVYNNPHLPDGQRIRDAAATRAIKPPEDIGVYNKVMEIRRLRREKNLPYEDALYLLGRSNDAFNEGKVVQAQVQTNVQLSQASQAAQATQQQFAREPAPGSGAPRFNVGDIAVADFTAIMRIPKENRTPEQVDMLKRIEEEKNMRPGELTEV